MKPHLIWLFDGSTAAGQRGRVFAMALLLATACASGAVWALEARGGLALSPVRFTSAVLAYCVLASALFATHLRVIVPLFLSKYERYEVGPERAGAALRSGGSYAGTRLGRVIISWPLARVVWDDGGILIAAILQPARYLEWTDLVISESSERRTLGAGWRIVMFHKVTGGRVSITVLGRDASASLRCMLSKHDARHPTDSERPI